ncbi:hypothetical protein ACLQ2Q_13235 [Microbacterium sp. DT81.1]|uniref:hypothetical protein n=1 Tax=Microbacterium sp. DT81.1 TaxID=3393413 RepID=UPI003CEB9BC8
MRATLLKRPIGNARGALTPLVVSHGYFAAPEFPAPPFGPTVGGFTAGAGLGFAPV